MRVYRDLTGDVNGLMNKFGIAASEIEEMIQYYTDWNADWREVQRIIDNQEAEAILTYERSGYEYGWRKAYEDVLDDVYIYFDLPNHHQISFRTLLSEKEKEGIPRYAKKWNCRVRSTLDMIGEELIIQYPEL